MDLAAIPREFPQFGKSILNIARGRLETFVDETSTGSLRHPGSGGMDLAAIPREFPQFGRSIWNVTRVRGTVFGSEPTETASCVCGSGCRGSCREGCGVSCGSSRADKSAGLSGLQGGIHAHTAAEGSNGSIMGGISVLIDTLTRAHSGSNANVSVATNVVTTSPSTILTSGELSHAATSHVFLCEQDPNAALISTTTNVCGADVTNEMLFWMAYVAQQQPDYRWVKQGLTGAWNWKDDTKKLDEWKCDVECPKTLFVCDMCLGV